MTHEFVDQQMLAEQRTGLALRAGRAVGSLVVNNELNRAGAERSGLTIVEGNLGRDGYVAFVRNFPGVKGQDAYALNPREGRFAVSDGMGAATDHEATALYSAFVAERAVSGGPNQFLNNIQGQQVVNAFTSRLGRSVELPRAKGSIVRPVGASLSYAGVKEVSSSGSKVRIVAIGDSPIFELDTEGKVVKQYGEDAQSGTTDSPLAFMIGVDREGKPIVPKTGTVVRGRSVVDQEIFVRPGHRVAIGSDFFSELPKAYSPGDFAGLSAEEFDTLVGTGIKESRFKGDDATLVVFDPQRFPPR